ncbi:MAG: hypothetical protein D6718_03695 [Acidobacteria bacterium]|nr:MAG: hypothetical protein D6718_03695 [Acidobacteriota bacterium]
MAAATPEAAVSAGLASILNAEAELFDRLAALAREQREALLAADRDLLEQLAAQAHTLGTRFTLLDAERRRLEEESGPQGVPADEEAAAARERAVAALRRLLEQAALSGAVFARLGDTVAVRQAAVSALFGASYLPDGRAAGLRGAGLALSKEG